MGSQHPLLAVGGCDRRRARDTHRHAERSEPAARTRRRGDLRVNYLLDTNAVVARLRNKPTKVRDRYRKAEASADYLALSSVVLFELW